MLELIMEDMSEDMSVAEDIDMVTVDMSDVVEEAAAARAVRAERTIVYFILSICKEL